MSGSASPPCPRPVIIGRMMCSPSAKRCQRMASRCRATSPPTVHCGPWIAFRVEDSSPFARCASGPSMNRSSLAKRPVPACSAMTASVRVMVQPASGCGPVRAPHYGRSGCGRRRTPRPVRAGSSRSVRDGCRGSPRRGGTAPVRARGSPSAGAVHFLEAAVQARVQACCDGAREQPVEQAQVQIPYPHVGGRSMLDGHDGDPRFGRLRRARWAG